MYTKEQLQAMSDFEVNRALSVNLGFRLDNGQDCNSPEVLVLRMSCDSLTSTAVDYCNNPSDIMPLAFEHKICLIDSEIGWIAFLFKDTDGELEFEHKNSLRAIACCLILVLQEQSK